LKRVIVVGGGIIGCSIAWRLAQRGVSVVVVEKDEPVSKASWAAAGMLHPLMPPGSPLQRLTDASFAEFPAFVEELQRVTGIDAQLQLDDTVGGGSVDNRKLGRAAFTAAAGLGVQFRTGISARRLSHSAGSFRSVELSDGSTLQGDVVVIAAGAWSGELLGLPIKVQVFPVKGQMLAVEHTPQLLANIIITDDVYLVPRGALRLLIGATVEHVGFDTHVTEAGINGLLTAAHQLVPAIADARIVETWAGLRPGTPDDLPILGEDPHIRGVFYATGHFRNGILLAPITARIMTNLIAANRTEYDLSAFSIGRFVVDVSNPRCDLCGAAMNEWHCRIICPSCGYQRDCSDP
jgi:glycine/D-amino acid oxidase-like deaminating enzyme